jgi:hypothetical protein
MALAGGRTEIEVFWGAWFGGCMARRYALPDITVGRRALAEARSTEFGEPGGIRTHDPMIKSHVLYQLSYGLTRVISIV